QPSNLGEAVDPAADGFELLVQLQETEAALLAEGSPVRAAGVTSGQVVELMHVEIDQERLAQARVRLSSSLGKVLRDDLQVVVGQAGGAGYIEIAWPGAHGQP